MQPFSKSPVRIGRVGTDAEHLHPRVLKVLETVAERTGLGRTDGGVVPGIEEQDDLTATTESRQADRFTARRGKREIGGGVTGSQRSVGLHWSFSWFFCVTLVTPNELVGSMY